MTQEINQIYNYALGQKRTDNQDAGMKKKTQLRPSQEVKLDLEIQRH